MEVLALRNLVNLYYKANSNKRNEIFYDGENDNVIIFEPFDDDVDREFIHNAISDRAYLHLTHELNTNQNVIVVWGAISSTTSDYAIYYDAYQEDIEDWSYKKITDYLQGLSNNTAPYKYIEIRNGFSKIIMFADEIENITA